MNQTIHFVAVKISLLTAKWSLSAAVSVLLLLSILHVPCSLHAQIPTYVPTSGLVGYWPFNGNANDESGNGNNGTVNGATLTTDRFGVANKAYSFNGISNTITIGNSTAFNFTNGQSISFWMNISSFPASNESIVFSQQTSSSTSAIGFNVGITAGGKLNYRIGNGSTATFAGCVNNSVNLNQWYHVICQIQNGQISVYLNAQITCTNNQPNAIVGSPGIPMVIGDDTWGAGNNAPNFSGKLDDIAIYNRALSQQEITNLYTNSVPPTITTIASPTLINCGESATLTASSTSAAQPCIKADLPATLQNGLVGYWPFCGNASDASGNNNNGTVNGATLTTDRFGNANSAYNFNGGSNRIVITNSILPNTPSSYTISLWVLNSSTGPGELICDRSQSNYDYKYRFHFRADLPGCPVSFASVSNTNVTGVLGGSFNTPTWKQLIAIGNSSTNTTTLYVDGQLIGNSGFYYPLELNSTTFGANFAPSGFDQSINGKLDDIAIYNRALTALEIQQLYNLGNVSYSWSTGATTPSITVSPAQTTAYTCTATNAAGSTTSSVTVNVADSLSWTGQFDTDWHKPCNWNPQFVPNCCNNVAVPLTSNQPIVSGVASAEDLTIYTTNGAQIIVNTGANLQIADCPTTVTTTACPSLAVLTTTAVSSITQTSAVSGGTISYQGASAITARGVCWGTIINPTIANSFTTNGTGVGTFTSNLTGLTAGTTYYVRAYATNASGTSYGNEVSFATQTLAAQYPAGSVFCASGPTAIVDVTNPTTGKTWMDRNLGASQVATSSTDAAAYGDLYQWGRGNDGHQCRNSATTATLSSTDQPGNAFFILPPNSPFDWRNPQNGNLWQGVNGVNNPCPSGYRLPTGNELSFERASWSAYNASGAFASVLKLPRTGDRGYNNGLITNSDVGCYWGSSVSSGSLSQDLRFNLTAGTFDGRRANAEAIRCIKN